MRIIVGRDYYDSGMAYGHDETLVFVRQRDHFLDTKEVAKGNIYHTPLVMSVQSLSKQMDLGKDHLRVNPDMYFGERMRNTDQILRAVTVIICGKEYHGFRLETTQSSDVTYFWNWLALEKWLDTCNVVCSTWGNGLGRNEFKIEEFFNPRILYGAAQDWLIDNRITILTYDPTIHFAERETRWRVNGDNLKDMQFFKVIDPITAFQEIEMWVGGILPRPGNPTVEITDDKIKVAKHGFDKFSFRKQRQDKASSL